MSTPKIGFAFSYTADVVKLCVPKASLPEREKEICRRIREARELRSLTQSECAERTGIRRSTLANYEALVTPLGYDEAKRVCYRLDINQRWLATGVLPRVPYFDISPNLEFRIKPNSLFSEAFDTVLRAPIEDQIATLISLIGQKNFLAGKFDNAVFNNLDRVGEDPSIAATFYVSKALSIRMSSMPERFKTPFASALETAEKQFIEEHDFEIKKDIRARQAGDAAARIESDDKKSGIDTIPQSGNTSDVKSELEKLIQRLKAATKVPGSKAELARLLGVAPTRISEWLSGNREPGGNYTLRLLHWVEQQERQK